MKTVSVTDLRRKPIETALAIAAAVQGGHGLEITRRGRVVEVIGADRPGKDEVARQLDVMRRADATDDFADFAE